MHGSTTAGFVRSPGGSSAISPAGRSPYDPDRRLSLIELPHPLTANAGGLDPRDRNEAMQWCKTDAASRSCARGALWTDLHDRIVVYAPFPSRARTLGSDRTSRACQLRGAIQGRADQSAQLLYHDGDGRGHPECPDGGQCERTAFDFQLPATGRPGRTAGESPWTFGVTFCRDLPLDQIVFDNPARLLSAPVTAPAVRFDSTRLIAPSCPCRAVRRVSSGTT